MNKDQIRNISIGVIAALLVVGAYYLTKDNTGEQPVLEENNSGEVDSNDTTINGDSSETVVTSKPTISVENKAKWDLAMTNASKAFNNRDYLKAIDYYNEALTYSNVDTVYSGLFNAYGAQGEWVKAESALNSAIKLNPSYTDYWVSKLVLLDEKTNTSYQDLKKIYNEGLLKVDSQTKINLVTSFARISESNNKKSEAIALWQKAIELNPTMSATYQAQIDLLNK